MTPPTQNSKSKIQNREPLLLAAIFLAGVALRLACPGRMAVEHFDEGVYASNIWFEKQQTFEYPSRQLYAPPLVPALIEWAMLLGGPSNLAPMLASLAAGCLLPLLVWWTGRQWFGPSAGIAAAALAALSEPHAVFSRTALTDSLLAFWMLAAVYAFWEAGRQGLTGRRETLPPAHSSATAGKGHPPDATAWPLWAALAGLFTGLAWWTKYNGWLPLAVALAGYGAMVLLPAAILLSQRSRADVGQAASLHSPAWQPGATRLAAVWLIAVAITCLVWGPYLYSLQERGGYAAVAANHRQYIDGWPHWADNLQCQAMNLRWLEGWIGALSPLAALAAALALASGRQAGECTIQNPSAPIASHPWWSLLILLALATANGAATSLAALTALAIACGGIRLSPAQAAREGKGGARSDVVPGMPGRAAHDTRLATLLLAAWFCGLLLVTPLYRGYARLTLPWLVAAWLGGGWGLALLFAENGLAPWREQWRRLRPMSRLILLAGLAAIPWSAAGRLSPRGVPAWQDRTAVARAAREIARTAVAAAKEQGGTADELVVYVYGEPAALFQLRLAGLSLVAPVSDLGFADPARRSIPYPHFLVTGPHADRDERFVAQFAAEGARFESLGEFPCPPSDVVLLDDYTPRQLAAGWAKEQQLTLWRVLP